MVDILMSIFVVLLLFVCNFCLYLRQTPEKIIDVYIRYEKLQRWDDALLAYSAKASQVTSPDLLLDATLGL